MEPRSIVTEYISTKRSLMESALSIAVISDTHDTVPQSLITSIGSADEIWHLGDICERESLNRLRVLPPDFLSVQGNCDPHGQSPQLLVLERMGVRFLLQHKPPNSSEPSVDAVLFGHLHYPVKRKTTHGYELNPGAVLGPRNGSQSSFAWLSISKGGDWNWRLETI